MEEKNNNANLAIASIPCQKWEPIYAPDIALKVGTIFPSLNKPFFKADTTMFSNLTDKVMLLESDIKNLEKEQLMEKIYEIDFVVNDLTLYLDTHPDDQEAFLLYKQALRALKELFRRFAREWYPLTELCVIEQLENAAIGCFSWAKGPAPWEGVENHVAI